MIKWSKISGLQVILTSLLSFQWLLIHTAAILNMKFELQQQQQQQTTINNNGQRSTKKSKQAKKRKCGKHCPKMKSAHPNPSRKRVYQLVFNHAWGTPPFRKQQVTWFPNVTASWALRKGVCLERGWLTFHSLFRPCSFCQVESYQWLQNWHSRFCPAGRSTL